MELDAIFFADSPSRSRIFGPNQIVSVSGNIPYRPHCIRDDGKGEAPRKQPFPTADLYVVPSDGQLAGGAKLTDLSGDPNRVIAFTTGAFVTETVAITAPTGATQAGAYDIVMDQCLDGYYNPLDGDFVLGAGPGYGFKVVIYGEVPPNPELQALKDAAADLADKTPVACAALEVARQLAKLDPRSTLNLTVAGDIAENSCANLVASFKGLAADPPRFDYDVLAAVGPIPIVPGPTATDLGREIRRTINLISEQAAEVEALLATVERLQGALADADYGSAMRQIHHADELAYMMIGPGGSLLRLYAALEALDAVAFDADPSVGAEIRVSMRAARYGIAALFSALGPRFVRPDPDTLVPVGLQAWVIALTTTDPVYLESGITSIPAYLATQGLPPIPNVHPTAATTGPYSAPPDRILTLDASSSSDPNGGALTYAWDLDADGSFADATTQTFNVSFDEPGTYLVGLRVTDPDGNWDLGYTLVRIGDVASQDMIVSRHYPREIMRVSPAGEVTVLYDGPLPGANVNAVHVDVGRDFYVQTTTAMYHFDPDGALLSSVTVGELSELIDVELGNLIDFIIDGSGRLVILADEYGGTSPPFHGSSHLLLQIDPSWSHATVVRSGIRHTQAGHPSLSVDPSGNLVLANPGDPFDHSPGPDVPCQTCTGSHGMFTIDPETGAIAEVIPSYNLALDDYWRDTVYTFGGQWLQAGSAFGNRSIGGIEVTAAGDYVATWQSVMARIPIPPALIEEEIGNLQHRVYIEAVPLYAVNTGGYYAYVGQDLELDAAGDVLFGGRDSEVRFGIFRVTQDGFFEKIADLGSSLDIGYNSSSLPGAISVEPHVRVVTPRDIPAVAPLRLGELRIDQSACPAVTVTVMVENPGSVAIPGPIPVVFYDGSPFAGADAIGRAEIPGALQAGASVAVSMVWDDPAPGAREIYAVATGTNTPSAVFMTCMPLPPENPLPLTPAAAELPVGDTHEVSTFVTDVFGDPMVGIGITFEVTGANPSIGVATTDDLGIARFSYQGQNPGDDVIVASRSGTASDPATVIWTHANSPPIADPNGPYTVNEGEPVTLDGSASHDPDGIIVSHEWDLDADGQYDDAVGVTAVTSFGDNGIQTVALLVTDDEGATGMDSAIVEVSNVAPSVGVPVVTPEPSVVGEPAVASATFTDPGADDAPFTCTVDYGEGGGPEAASVGDDTCTGPAHAYGKAGIFTLTVIVTDKDGGSGSSQVVHEVELANQPPVADAGDDQTVEWVPGGTPVTLDGTGSWDPDGDPLTYEWSGPFAGAIVSGPTPTVVFADLGTYEVELLVDDGNGGVATDRVLISVVFTGEYLLIDEDSIDSDLKAIEEISHGPPFCGGRGRRSGEPSVCINDDIADPGVRVWLFTRPRDITPFTGLVLPTGEHGDEGLFRFTRPDPQLSLQNGALFTIAEFFSASGAASDENNLDKIAGVAPLGEAEILGLVGRVACAVVFDSDISVDLDDGYGSLKGSTLGITAFLVTAWSPNHEGGDYLPMITVDLLAPVDASQVCGPGAPYG